jgi:hypothetical protein
MANLLGSSCDDCGLLKLRHLQGQATAEPILAIGRRRFGCGLGGDGVLQVNLRGPATVAASWTSPKPRGRSIKPIFVTIVLAEKRDQAGPVTAFEPSCPLGPQPFSKKGSFRPV